MSEDYIARRTGELVNSFGNYAIGTPDEKYTWKMEIVGDDESWLEMKVDADSVKDILDDIKTDIDYDKALEREEREDIDI